MYLKTSDIYHYLYLIMSILVDLLLILSSLEIALYIRTNILQDILPSFDIHRDMYYWICFIISVVLTYNKIYSYRYDFFEDVYRILRGLLFTFFIVFAILVSSKTSLEYSRVFIFIFFILLAIILPASKIVTKRVFFLFDIFKIPVKLISKDKKLKKILKNEILNNSYLGLKLDNKKYNIAMITSQGFSVDKLQECIEEHSKIAKNIYIIPYAHNISLFNFESINYFNSRISVIKIENKLLNKKDYLIKNIFEKCFILLILPFFFLLHIFISVLIYLNSKGEIIYKQKRLGRDKKIFYVYKYRTLYENNESILQEYLKNNPKEIENYKKYHKYQNDPRATSIGRLLRKTSLDELPQIFNVLKGDMNLVGPRPYMINERGKIPKMNKNIILKVKPGITGLWQVSGRNKLSFSERIDIDKWYVQNWSLWIDIVILLKTFRVVWIKS